MKKLLFVGLIIILSLVFRSIKVEASDDYNGFDEVVMESGKLLENFTDAEYNEYYSYVDKRKFWGWNVHIVNDKVPCTYIARTVYETTNDIINASGSISYGLSGSVKKFKNDLDAEVDLEYKYQITEGKQRTEKIKIPVEGKTKLLVTVIGQGYVTNGVASLYMFWINVEKGGFEYFTITSEYQKIEKVAI